MPQIAVRVETRGDEGRVAYVALENRRKLNTLNSALMVEFIGAFEKLGRDDLLRAVVLTGAGEKAFVGGADIDEMAALDANSAAAFITRLHRCCEAVRELPVPVVARISGYALGGGLELAAACDLRIASHTALFGMPEVKLGIPSVVEAALLPPLIGWGRTRQMLLLGETYTATEAAGWGLVEMTVAAEELDPAVELWVQSILDAGPLAIRLQKKLIRQWEDLPLSAAVHAGIGVFTEAWTTPEPRRRMQDFLARARSREQKRG